MFTRVGFVGLCDGIVTGAAPEHGPVGRPVSGVMNIPFSPGNLKLFVPADISISGRTFHTDRALFDTGATITAASPSVIGHLAGDSVYDGIAHGVCGDSAAQICSASLSLPGGILIPDVSLWLFDLPEQTADLIIGMDVISRGHFTIDGTCDRPYFSFRF
ncbi:MAG: retroviral-like aspartic protease family protein [Clostridium sp.]|nr:retroviral-like aspartic protease family protein [Clostridium sp.]